MVSIDHARSATPTSLESLTDQHVVGGQSGLMILNSKSWLLYLCRYPVHRETLASEFHYKEHLLHETLQSVADTCRHKVLTCRFIVHRAEYLPHEKQGTPTFGVLPRTHKESYAD